MQAKWARQDAWPKRQKHQCNTKIDSGRPIVLMISVDSGPIWKWDQFHWKFYLHNFPDSPRMPQLSVVCDMGISFNVDSSWMCWTLDIEIVSKILVRSNFSWT
jgi:hypothetical protein